MSTTIVVPALLGSLLPRACTYSPSLLLSPSFLLFLPFSRFLPVSPGFLFSYAFCETPPSSSLSVIRPSTQIKVSSADLPRCVPLTPFPLSYSPLPSSEKGAEGFESVRDPSNLRGGGTLGQPEKHAEIGTQRNSWILSFPESSDLWIPPEYYRRFLFFFFAERNPEFSFGTLNSTIFRGFTLSLLRIYQFLMLRMLES